MDKILERIENKLDSLEKNMNEKFSQVNSRLDNLEQGQKSLKTELKKDIKDLSTMLVTSANRFDTLNSEITGVSKKLDRLSAKQDIFSATVKEHELRLEDLEVSPPAK